MEKVETEKSEITIGLYEVRSAEELEAYLKKLFLEHEALISEQQAKFPDSESGFYAGCNFNINQGTNEWEPLGSATSMHDCDGCEELSFCTMKKSREIWFHGDKAEETST